MQIDPRRLGQMLQAMPSQGQPQVNPPPMPGLPQGFPQRGQKPPLYTPDYFAGQAQGNRSGLYG